MRTHFGRAVRLALGLYVAGCVVVSTLLLMGYGAILAFVWANPSEAGTDAFIAASVTRSFNRQPKQLDFKQIYVGDWQIACLVGRVTFHDKIAEMLTASGASFDAKEISRIGSDKHLATLLIIQHDGRVQWSKPSILASQVGGGEILCATPGSSSIQLPTAEAMRKFNN